MLKKLFILICLFSLLLANSFYVRADANISICGFQYNTKLNGYRIIYTTPSNVKESGVIFGASFNGATDDDLVLNNNSDIIRSYKASDKAVISYDSFIYEGGSQSFPSSNNYYLFTVIKNGDTKKQLELNQAVRPYAILNDDTIVYGKIQHFSVYKIAYSLYYNCLSFSRESHEFLYNNIIKVCDPDAPKKEFDWSGVVNF